MKLSIKLTFRRRYRDNQIPIAAQQRSPGLGGARPVSGGYEARLLAEKLNPLRKYLSSSHYHNTAHININIAKYRGYFETAAGGAGLAFAG